MRGDRPQGHAIGLRNSAFTPHARGSTMILPLLKSLLAVYPACAGIDLRASNHPQPNPRLPRMRGDRPHPRLLLPHQLSFTPHARGSTLQKRLALQCKPVYPACAGIDRSSVSTPRVSRSLPRMRGDRPWSLTPMGDQSAFTPHARGSTWYGPEHGKYLSVYPACAGIDREKETKKEKRHRLPRMRGDRPS